MATTGTGPPCGELAEHTRFLNCFLCDRTYQQPKLLPCLHSFCLQCLNDYVAKEQLARAAGDRGRGSTSTSNTRSDQSALASDTDYIAIGTSEPATDTGEHVDRLLESNCGTGSSDMINEHFLKHPFMCCPMCKTDVNLPKLGVLGFKDNLLIVQMIRRWTEKNDLKVSTTKHDQDGIAEGSKSEDDSLGDSLDAGAEVKCTCLPAWRTMADSACPAQHMATVNTSNSEPNNVDSCIKYIDNDPACQYYCLVCEVITCQACIDTVHQDHQTMTVAKATEDKKAYLDRLLTSLQDKVTSCDTAFLQVENSHQHLLSSTEHVVKEIEERAEKLTHVVEKRRNQLISELSLILKLNEQKHSICKDRLHELQERLKTASKFSQDLLKYGSCSDIMYLNSDVSDRLHELLREQSHNGADIMNVQLEVPDFGQDDSHLEKAFGALVKGEVKCGSAELLRSFDIDLKWPTGMATTKNKEFVVTGKMGAFEEKGKVMFFGRSGQLKNVYDLQENCIPYDTTVTSDGTVLVSDNSGKIHKFDSSGCKMEVMEAKFKGVGRLATVENMWGHFVVTSSEERQVHVYKPNGDWYLSLPKPDDSRSSDIQLLHPHYVATNRENDIIVSDFEQNAMFVFNSKGDLRFQYGGNGINGGDLRCPSAVCCDHFNNILVADFMNDRVHLVSQSGHFLGYLLTKDNDISCPNFLSIDQDGHLFVGQYGGRIQVFRYLSYVKFV